MNYHLLIATMAMAAAAASSGFGALAAHAPAGPAAQPGAAPQPYLPGQTERKSIRFSGYDWIIKAPRERMGPGPNWWSDSEESVSVDSAGRLHLRISQRDGKWYCAEIISARSFGFGTYRFTVETPAESLPDNAILGLFTWSDDRAYEYREIDIELSRWGRAGDPDAQFVVQSSPSPHHKSRFNMPASLKEPVYSFTWRKESIAFEALGRASDDPNAGSSLVREWTSSRGIPQSGGENVRMNLWLQRGHAPAGGKGCEVILSRFEFVPLPQ